MAIVLNGTTGITAPDIDVTAQASDITTTGDITAVDATLSGGVYLGGTGSANYLDDYETGTFTPTVANVTSGTPDYRYQQGSYVKIGDFVRCTGIIGLNNSSSLNGNMSINLPFGARTMSYGQAVGGASDGQGFTFPILGTYDINFTIGSSDSVARVVGIAPSGSAYTYTTGGVSNVWYFRFNICYQTN